MICPSTRSAMKAVRPKKAKGMRTKPARVTSLNSRIVTNTCTARMKKERTTMIQATSKIRICMKLTNNPNGHTRTDDASRKGQADIDPVGATTTGSKKKTKDS